MKNIEKGMTLIELTVVLLILIALAGIAIPYVSGTSRMAMCQATDATMQAVKEAIMGGGAGSGFYGDTLGYYPKDTKDTDLTNINLKHLFSKPAGFNQFNPKTAVGWNGPYLMTGITLSNSGIYNVGDLSTRYTNAGNNYVHEAYVNNMDTVLDAWGRPIVLQVEATYGARLVSAGPLGGIGFSNGDIDTQIDEQRQNDDRVLNLQGTTPANIPCVDYN